MYDFGEVKQSLFQCQTFLTRQTSYWAFLPARLAILSLFAKQLTNSTRHNTVTRNVRKVFHRMTNNYPLR
jgi:hypothetical protein